mgnify:FL=1
MTPVAKAHWQIHVCVLLWGFTAILGKLITLPALPLVYPISALATGPRVASYPTSPQLDEPFSRVRLTEG